MASIGGRGTPLWLPDAAAGISHNHAGLTAKIFTLAAYSLKSNSCIKLFM